MSLPYFAIPSILCALGIHTLVCIQFIYYIDNINNIMNNNLLILFIYLFISFCDVSYYLLVDFYCRDVILNPIYSLSRFIFSATRFRQGPVGPLSVVERTLGQREIQKYQFLYSKKDPTIVKANFSPMIFELQYYISIFSIYFFCSKLCQFFIEATEYFWGSLSTYLVWLVWLASGGT